MRHDNESEGTNNAKADPGAIGGTKVTFRVFGKILKHRLGNFS